MQGFQHQPRAGLAKHFQTHPHPGGIIVCEEPRFIYMKPTRTGGTSILRMTLEKMPLDIFHHKNHPDRFEAWLSQVTDADLERYFIFTFVRNPWDRAVSIASHFRIPFHRFAGEYQQLIAQNHNLLLHSLPLHHYAYVEQRLFVDFIGRFETLQKDFDRLCEIVGFPQTCLPTSNQSTRGTYGDYYDAVSKQQIDQIYKKDAKCFRYQFRTSRKRLQVDAGGRRAGSVPNENAVAE